MSKTTVDQEQQQRQARLAELLGEQDDSPRSMKQARKMLHDWMSGAKLTRMAEGDQWHNDIAFSALPKGSYNFRDLSVGTNSAGGFTVGSAVAPILVSKLQIGAPILRFARVIEVENGAPLDIPTADDTANVGTLVAENTSSGTSTTATIGVQATRGYAIKSGIVVVSRELMTDNGLFVDDMLGLLAARVARGMAGYLATGTGSSQPHGFVTAATNSSITSATTTPTMDELLSLKYSVNCEYFSSPSTCFVMHPTTWRLCKQAFAAEAATVYRPRTSPDGFDTFDGHPVVETTTVETGAAKRAVVFGDFSRFIVRVNREVEIRRLIETYLEEYRIGLSMVQRFDSRLCDSAAIKYLSTP